MRKRSQRPEQRRRKKRRIYRFRVPPTERRKKKGTKKKKRRCTRRRKKGRRSGARSFTFQYIDCWLHPSNPTSLAPAGRAVHMLSLALSNPSIHINSHCGGAHTSRSIPSPQRSQHTLTRCLSLYAAHTGGTSPRARVRARTLAPLSPSLSLSLHTIRFSTQQKKSLRKKKRRKRNDENTSERTDRPSERPNGSSGSERKKEI